jgi:hypothetical protein
MATLASTTDYIACSSAERERARALALLQANQTGTISIGDLRDIGVRAPGQAVYDLQLAGYQIDRVSHITADGLPTVGYRLHHAAAREPDQVAISPEGLRDGT